MINSDNHDALRSTRQQLISVHDFKVVIWVGVGLCAIVSILRFYVRILCFRRLLFEDYLMMTAMVILVAQSIVLQTSLGDLYKIFYIQNGLKISESDVLIYISHGLHGHGITLTLSVIGIWIIKVNFMILFYRIGYRIRVYLISWWAALIIILCCGIVTLGMIPYNCVMGSPSYIATNCSASSRSQMQGVYVRYIVSVITDILSDIIIICFPTTIIWNTGIKSRQKLILSGIFLLVGFTIGITVTRGTLFNDFFRTLGKSQVGHQRIDSEWTAMVLFWVFIEYVVSYIIACLISFRALWTHKNKVSRPPAERRQQEIIVAQNQQTQAGDYSNSSMSRWRRMSGNLLTTFISLEGTAFDQNDSESRSSLNLHLATIDVDISNWYTNHGADASAPTVKEV